MKRMNHTVWEATKTSSKAWIGRLEHEYKSTALLCFVSLLYSIHALEARLRLSIECTGQPPLHAKEVLTVFETFTSRFPCCTTWFGGRESEKPGFKVRQCQCPRAMTIACQKSWSWALVHIHIRGNRQCVLSRFDRSRVGLEKCSSGRRRSPVFVQPQHQA